MDEPRTLELPVVTRIRLRLRPTPAGEAGRLRFERRFHVVAAIRRETARLSLHN